MHTVAAEKFLASKAAFHHLSHGGSDMEIELPQEFTLQREVYAIQLFCRNLLQRIPPNAVILEVGPSTHQRMIEVLWEEKRYIVFERDLKERTEPLAKPEDQDPDGSPCPNADGYVLGGGR